MRETRDELLRNQIAASIATGIDVPQPIMEALYRFRNEERTVSFLVVDHTAIAPVGAPDQTTLEDYFEANKQRFQAPEYRKLGILVADPAALADPAAVTDVEVAAEYEARKASFTQPERRRIEQLRFATKEAAEAALKQSQGGADFAALVAGGRQDARRGRPRHEDHGGNHRSEGRGSGFRRPAGRCGAGGRRRARALADPRHRGGAG